MIKYNILVSVPSRGLRYLNVDKGYLESQLVYSFRPLTGIKVSELHKIIVLSFVVNRFRPLTGIKVSEQKRDCRTNTFWRSFRPLTGIKVSEQCNELVEKYGLLVSVPSRGLRYLNRLRMFNKDGFRFPSPHGD